MEITENVSEDQAIQPDNAQSDSYKRLSKHELDALLDTLLTAPTTSAQATQLQRALHELHVHQIELEIQNRELREAQQRLEEARDRYADIYDFSPVGYLTLDAKGKILGINLRGAAMLGRERSRLIDTPLTPLLWGGESRTFFEHLHRVFHSSDMVMHELKLKLPGRSSEAVVVRMESVWVNSAGGETNSCHTAIIEITEQKKIEAALRSERDRAQRYLDTVEAIIVALDRNGHIKLVNRKGCELLGASESELIGKHWFSLCVPSTRESAETLRIFQLVMAGKLDGSEYYENKIISRSGKEYLIAWHNNYLTDGKGNITGTLSAGEDITLRRSVERALDGQRKVLMLLATGADLQSVLTSLVTAAEELHPNIMCSVLLLDDDGKYLVHGAAPSLPDAYNQSISGMEIGQGAGWCAAAAVIHELVIVEDILNHPDWTDFTELTEQAGLRACWSVPIISTHGTTLGIVANYCRDVHTPTAWELNSTQNSASLAGIAIERWRGEQQAQLHQAELAHIARLNTMGEMATGMAHELNQPLTAIATYADAALRMLKSGTADRDKLKEALQGSRDQARRASELIRHLRQLVRKQPPLKKDVDLSVLIKQVVSFIQFGATRQKQKIVLELDRHLPQVSVDSIQLEQVLLNLIRNALEAMQSAKCAIQEVTLSTGVNADGWVQITVADTGPGIKAETLQHIFEPFMTSKGAAGMGMGLSICRSIMEAHNGHLWAESRPGQGATLYVTLPRAAPGKQEPV